jgi:DNA polymerase III alpha subunit
MPIVCADIKRRVDEFGRVQFSGEDAAELLLRGHDITDLLFTPSAVIEQYNDCCTRNNKANHRLQTDLPAVDLDKRLATWWISDEFRDVDVRSVLLARCQSAAEVARVEEEMALYEARDMLPVLRLMLFLVDHFRKNHIVWGVGRGSSVASFVLFLIGIHKIDSLKYNLDIHEFLRESA